MRDCARVRSRSGRWRGTRLAVWLTVAGAIAAPAGWFGTDALERDNDFCNACHLQPGVPLHIDLRRRFDARPAVDLAGLHGPVQAKGRAMEEPFRCIDCHGGVGFVGKARTKWLAVVDGFWFAVGHFDEPTGMSTPLRDEDCTQCHAVFQVQDEGIGPPPFHALSVHNAALGVACVTCHVTHDTGGDEDLYYLHPAQVRRECARCHSEFE